MNISRIYVIILSVIFVAVMDTAIAAAELPHIGYVYPAGGKPGTEFEIKVGGQFIYGAKSACVSGRDVTVQVIDSREPEKKKPNSQKKAIEEIVKLKVAISGDAAAGDRELCLITDTGISNKLTFNIGQLKEIMETEPNDRRENAVSVPELPVLVNGQIMPGDVDFFKFNAKKGQHLVIEASARALIPYMADAVPGWFKICLTLYDAKGGELAFADDFRYEQDPVLFYNIPADGDYFLAVRDSIYRGREDFVYRVKIGELPYITNIFPLGAPSGKNPVSVKIYGVNLPVNSIDADVDKSAPDIQKISVKNNGLVSNQVAFSVGGLPEVFAADSCNARKTAQKIAVPVIINGRIINNGDRNYFCFEGKKGQTISIEVYARRLGSPLDSFITLFNSRGEKLKENDDRKDLSEGYITHHADSGLTHILPENGIYTVQIYDTQGKGGTEYAYRLRVSAPEPDFALIAAPASLTLSKGGTAMLTVYVVRREGFNGRIALNLKNNNSGLTLRGAVIPENFNKVRITISASAQSLPGITLPVLEGTALINGRNVCHAATPAEDETQAFSSHHLVDSGEETVLINDSSPFTISAAIPPEGYIELAQGKEVSIPLEIIRKPDLKIPVSIQLVDPPKGISIKNGFIPAAKDKHAILLRAEFNAAPGITDNLILTGTAYIEREEPPMPKKEDSKESPKIQEKKEKENTAGNNVAPKNVSIKEAPKIKKEKVTVMLPAIPFKIMKQPDKEDRKI
ncbi:MAG: PPC domain-containing protein [Victivallaceae bacterium]|jgi:hypothetical protein